MNATTDQTQQTLNRQQVSGSACTDLLSGPCPYGQSCGLDECDPYCAHECDIRSRMWTAVDDGLPDDDVIVIVYVADESEPVWLGYMDEDAEWRYITGGRCHPTHWMDLPMPPVTVYGG